MMQQYSTLKITQQLTTMNIIRMYCLLAMSFVVTFTVGTAQTTKQIAQPKLIAFPRVPPEAEKGTDAYTYFMQNSHVQQTVVAIQTVLGERGAQYRGFEQAMQDLKKKEMQNKGLSGDMNALLAMQSGADIKLVFTTKIESNGPFKKARVSIEVEEVATSLGLGSAQGVSDEIATEDISGLCIAAVNNCIDRVLSTVQSYWQQVPTKGKPVRVIISSTETDLSGEVNGEYYTDAIDDLLKKNTVSFQNSVSTERVMEYSANVDMLKYEQIGDFSKELRTLINELVKPAKAKVEKEGNALIRITLP